ncbi:MAG: hypothetical protein ATN36_00900 [Epulopiscium sp. Nele67-Bin005]|nr:MAG: hypothetical protein ATN36_00900 [Epulopiscium sp. Nele67-Bin005]
MKHIFFPLKCIACQSLISKKYIPYTQSEFICKNCYMLLEQPNKCKRCSKLIVSEKGVCLTCKDVYSDITQIRSLYPYSYPIKQSIARWKYNGVRKYAKGYAELLAQSYKYDPLEIEIDGVIPVPVSKKRFAERGFNQAEDLAKEFAKFTDLPICDILERPIHTKAQSKCENKEERDKNIQGAISLNVNYADKLLKVKQSYRFIIIDDIYTTGSTIEACIKVIRQKYEIADIYVFTVCITT